jgi:phytoene dehydrogenase-like protein
MNTGLSKSMKDVAIIGAGLAGIYCALILQKAGLDVVVLEASDAPGGRIRTDRVEGFLLDRGFQVLLTAYPEAQRALDYGALDLHPLKPGALVWKGGRFHWFADPFREPLAAIGLAFDPIVALGDKLRVAKLRAQAQRGPIAGIFAHRERSTRQFLQEFGFSPQMIAAFFEPFFGGVFLEKELATSSRYFEFLFRMFSSGAVAVPAAGMQAIPQQLADRLQPGTVALNRRVERISPEDAGFSISGEGQPVVSSRSVVIATEEPEARRLQSMLSPGKAEIAARKWNSTIAFYFAAERPPVDEAILLLNGEGESAGPVNNAVVMSQASASYAPAGAHLVSASVVGERAAGGQTVQEFEKELEKDVRRHLSVWFGGQVSRWRSLGSRLVGRALPLQQTAAWEQGGPSSGIENVFLCGDYLETSSIQGSLVSGRRAAEALLAAGKF